MKRIQLKTPLTLSVMGAFIAALMGCLGASSTTGSEAARSSAKNLGAASDTTGPGSACGREEEDDNDSLEAAKVGDRDSADEKDESEVAGKGCDEGEHHGIQGGHEDEEDHDFRTGRNEKEDGDDMDDGEDDDSLEVAVVHK